MVSDGVGGTVNVWRQGEYFIAGGSTRFMIRSGFTNIYGNKPGGIALAVENTSGIALSINGGLVVGGSDNIYGKTTVLTVKVGTGTYITVDGISWTQSSGERWANVYFREGILIGINAV